MDFLGGHNYTLHRIIKATVCASNACEFLSGNADWRLWGALHAYNALWLLGITSSLLESPEAEVKHSLWTANWNDITWNSVCASAVRHCIDFSRSQETPAVAMLMAFFLRDNLWDSCDQRNIMYEAVKGYFSSFFQPWSRKWGLQGASVVSCNKDDLVIVESCTVINIPEYSKLGCSMVCLTFAAGAQERLGSFPDTDLHFRWGQTSEVVTHK